MRVLVTGGHGFIGSHVLKQLVEEGHEVACFDIAEPSAVSAPVVDDVTSVRGDVSDPVQLYDAIASFEPDCIIHLASMLSRGSQQNPRRAIEVNVLGSIYVLEAAKALDVRRVVVASSAASYGELSPELETFDETTTQSPSRMYGLTKFCVERIGEVYDERGDVEFAAIEPVHGIGPNRVQGNDEDAAMIKAAVRDRTLTLPEFEDPVEMIYVGDEARAFIQVALAETTHQSRYLIGAGERASLRDLAEYVQDVVGDVEMTFKATERENELNLRPLTDTTRIRSEFGWEPTHSIEDAVETYVDWLESNPEAWSV